MSPPLPSTDARAWRARLFGVTLPGITTVRGMSTKWKLDKAPGLGLDGGTITGKGREIPEFELAVRVWTDADLAVLWALAESVTGSADKVRTPVYHPALELHGIRDVYVEAVEGPEVEDPGFVTITFKCVRYAPGPKPVKKSAAQTSGGISGALGAPAFDPKFRPPPLPKPSADYKPEPKK